MVPCPRMPHEGVVPPAARVRGTVAPIAMSDFDLLTPGSVLAERYRIGHRLGHGAMGAVYYAEHLTVGRSVAVKVLARAWRHDAEMVERFRTEARSASAAGHPNIVDVLDAGELDDGTPWLVMEYLAGRTLYAVMQDEGPFDLVRAATIGREVGRALLAAHREGVIHRDLKAENVMLIERGGQTLVKVLDFGVAHVSTLQERRTTPGSVIGTPEYIAPEAVLGLPPTPALDVYALGVLLHEMLVGEAPFAGRDPARLLEWKLEHTPPSIAELRPDLPRNAVTLVDLCLARTPEERPGTDDVVEALERILEPRHDRVSLLPARPRPRRRLGALALAVATGVVVGGVVWAVLEPVGRTNVPVPQGENAVVDARPVPEEPPVPDEPIDDEPPQPLGPPVQVEPPKARVPERRAPIELPSVERDPPPRPTPPSVSKAECSLEVKRAFEARDAHDWDGVLRYTKTSKCIAAGERMRLRVKALKELGRFADCIALGERSSDPDVQLDVKVCQRRRPS